MHLGLYQHVEPFSHTVSIDSFTTAMPDRKPLCQPLTAARWSRGRPSLDAYIAESGAGTDLVRRVADGSSVGGNYCHRYEGIRGTYFSFQHPAVRVGFSALKYGHVGFAAAGRTSTVQACRCAGWYPMGAKKAVVIV